MITRIFVYSFILLSVFLIQACSHSVIRYKRKHTEVHQELDAYRNYINLLSNGKIGKKSTSIGMVEYEPKNPNLLGRCLFTTNPLGKEIDIVKDQWYYLSDERKLILVAHEFIHCDCTRFGHEEKYFKDGCPTTIMDAYLPDEKCVEDHFYEYMSQIQKGCYD